MREAKRLLQRLDEELRGMTNTQVRPVKFTDYMAPVHHQKIDPIGYIAELG